MRWWACFSDTRTGSKSDARTPAFGFGLIRRAQSLGDCGSVNRSRINAFGSKYVRRNQTALDRNSVETPNTYILVLFKNTTSEVRNWSWITWKMFYTSVQLILVTVHPNTGCDYGNTIWYRHLTVLLNTRIFLVLQVFIVYTTCYRFHSV